MFVISLIHEFKKGTLTSGLKKKQWFGLVTFLVTVRGNRCFLMPEQNVNELNQWLSAIRKASICNERMLPSFHPGAHRSGKWTCCLQADRAGNPAFITSDAARRRAEAEDVAIELFLL